MAYRSSQHNHENQYPPESKATLHVHSVDYGIAWNPYCVETPKSRGEWVFSTPATARYLNRLVSSEDPHFLLLVSSDSQATQPLDEIYNEIASAGGNQTLLRTARVAGANSLFDVAAFAIEHFATLFPGATNRQITLRIGLPRYAILDDGKCCFTGDSHSFEHTVISRPPSVFNADAARLSDRFVSIGSLKDRMVAAAPAAAMQIHAVEVVATEDLCEDVAETIQLAMAETVDIAAGKMLICVGADSVELQTKVAELVAALAARYPSTTTVVLQKSDVVRIRAGIPAAVAAVKDALRANATIIVASPNVRKTDRLLFISLASAERVDSLILWLTRPSWWGNRHVATNPELDITMQAAACAFEPPSPDESIVGIMRLV